MSTTGTAQMSKKDQIKIMRRGVAPKLGDVLTAEAVLLDAQTAASAGIHALIVKSGNPQHKFTVDKGTPNERKILATFRKIGEYMADKDGAPITADDGGNYPAGTKPAPLYGMKLTDLSDDDDE